MLSIAPPGWVAGLCGSTTRTSGVARARSHTNVASTTEVKDTHRQKRTFLAELARALKPIA